MTQRVYVHEFKGEFFLFAGICGNSNLGLEYAVRYSGKYNLTFGSIDSNPERDLITGIFQKPNLGCIRVSYSPARNPNYMIGGESYGECIKKVLLDFTSALNLEPMEMQEKLKRKTQDSMRVQEDWLRGFPDEDTKKTEYSQLLHKLLNINLPYDPPVIEKSAEAYADDKSIDLSYYDRHTVIFEFPSDLDFMVSDISSKVRTGLIENAPEGTLALVERKFSVKPGESKDTFVNIAEAIALVRNW